MTSLTILNTVLAQTVQAVSDTIAAANNVVAASANHQRALCVEPVP